MLVHRLGLVFISLLGCFRREVVLVLAGADEILQWLFLYCQVSCVVELEVVQMVLLLEAFAEVCLSLVLHDLAVVLCVGEALVHLDGVAREPLLELVFTPAQVGPLHALLLGVDLHLLPPFFQLDLPQLELLGLLDAVPLIRHICYIFELVVAEVIFLRKDLFGLLDLQVASWLALLVENIDLLLLGVKHAVVHIDHIYLYLFDVFKTIIQLGVLTRLLARGARLD